MKFTRRQFIKTSVFTGALVASGGVGSLLRPRKAFAFAQSPTNIRKFVVALPGLGPTGANEIGQYIPVAVPNKLKYPGVDFYKIDMVQYTQLMHPDLPRPTKLWGYVDMNNPDPKYLGGAIVAQRGTPVRIDFNNHLPPTHILPVDTTLPGAESGQAQNRAAVHLHGGLVPWTSDGGPFDWFTPDDSDTQPFTHGPDWQPGDIWYPNNQSSRFVWYHDHALGITRLNAYAGLATAYLITDTVEQNLISSNIIPGIGIPLVLQDKSFKSVADQWGLPGDLWYASVYEDVQSNPVTGRWDRGGIGILPLPNPSNVPEFFSDTAMVNGALYPYLKVEPRRYRFRLLNGSQARFYNLQLCYADQTGQEADLTKPGPAFIQIGTEGGFLPAPVVLNNPPQQIGFDPNTGNANQYTLLLGCAERADIIIDFSSCQAGDKLILYSDSPAPFPGGDPRNDYFTGDPDQTAIGGAPTTLPGFGPNTRTLMQFQVVPLTGSPDPYNFAQTLNLLNTALPVAFANSQPPLLSNAVGTYVAGLGKTLNEDFDNYGRLIQRIGTTAQSGVNNEGNPTRALDYLSMPPTETANNGETQVWNIFNLTGDTHPIHFHLVNVQILSRAPFDAVTPDFTAIGPPVPPDANELGWKETVRMNPGEVTTVIMKFDAPAPPEWIDMKTSPRTGGYEYVWHCHILDHEEHDMMRPLVIMCAGTTAIKLASFEAKPDNRFVKISWKTESELDNAGFNLYRADSENGQYIKINKALIPSKGNVNGAAYNFIDKDVQNRKTYYYKLEDIDLKDKGTLHGPVSATPRLIAGLSK